MQWCNIMKPERTQDLRISEYSMEELTPVVVKKNKTAGNFPQNFKAHKDKDLEPIEEQTDRIGGKLSAIERDAYEKGFASGEQAGREIGLKTLEGMTQRLKKLLIALHHHKENVLKASEEDILLLVLAVANRVLGQELSQNQEYVTDTIRKAVQIIGRNESITIRIHPETLEKLRNDRPETTQLFQEFQDIKLEPDLSLIPGECVVESNQRMIDARVETQISTVAKKLKTMAVLERDEERNKMSDREDQ